MMFVLFCCGLCCLLIVFFFFKQKTAYEMRISDWSSDVCSSDLHAARLVALVLVAVATGKIDNVVDLGKQTIRLDQQLFQIGVNGATKPVKLDRKSVV